VLDLLRQWLDRGCHVTEWEEPALCHHGNGGECENARHEGKGTPFVSRAKRTHCKHGHEYTSENTKWRDNGRWQFRVCRACIREYSRRRRAA